MRMVAIMQRLATLAADGHLKAKIAAAYPLDQFKEQFAMKWKPGKPRREGCHPSQRLTAVAQLQSVSQISNRSPSGPRRLNDIAPR